VGLLIPVGLLLSRLRILPGLLGLLLTDRFDFTRGVGLVGIGGGRTAYVANLPNVSLTLADLDRVILSLRRMRLRTSTGTEATFFAGERFPVAFATFSIIFIPQIIQDLIDEERFVPPVPAIRYEEIGLKLTAAARVHNHREISLAVTLESTQLAGEGINGIPIIGTRRLEQKVRLKEGESVVLSGMRGLERTRGRAGWPLLGAIPVLGRLFSRTENRTRETEFLVLLTPHLVRGGERDARTQQALYLGTEKEFAPVGRAQAGRRAPRARPRPRGAPRQPLRPQPEQHPQPPRQNPQPRQQHPNRNQ